MPEPTPARGRPRRGYFLPGAIALVALIGIAAALGAGDLSHPAPTGLHGADLDAKVALQLQIRDRASSPPSVHCPDREPARAGVSFSCAVGRSGSVTVTEVDDRGGLRVGSVSP